MIAADRHQGVLMTLLIALMTLLIVLMTLLIATDWHQGARTLLIVLMTLLIASLAPGAARDGGGGRLPSASEGSSRVLPKCEPQGATLSAISIPTLHASAHHGTTYPHRCEPRGATLSAIIPGGLRGAAPTPLLNRSLERLVVLMLAPARRTSRLAGVVGPVGAHVILNTSETAKPIGVNVTEGPYVLRGRLNDR